MPRIIPIQGMGLRVVGEGDYEGADPSLSTDNEFMKGLRSAEIGGSGVLGDGASALMTEALKAERDGKPHTAALLKQKALEMMETAKAIGPRISDVRDVQSVGDAADWLAGAVGSGVDSAATSVAGGLAGAAAGGMAAGPAGAIAGGLAGGFGASYNPSVDEQVVNSMMDPAIRATRTPDEILAGARLTGAGNATLDAIGGGVMGAGRKVIGRTVGKALGRELLADEGAAVARSVADDVAKKGAARYVADRVGESLLEEGATGGAQNILGQINQNQLAGREGIDWGDVAADAAAEAAGGLAGAGPAVAQAAYGKAVGAKRSVFEPDPEKADAPTEAGATSGSLLARGAGKLEEALHRAVRPGSSDRDFDILAEPIDPSLSDEEVSRAGDERVLAAKRLYEKVRDNKALTPEELEAAVKFEADMRDGDPDIAASNLHDNLSAIYQKRESKAKVGGFFGKFFKRDEGRKANAMSTSEDADSKPDDMDQVMRIWQEKIGEGDSAFADTIDDHDVGVARRAFAEWVKNDFRDPDTGKLFIPREMAETLGKKAGDAVHEAFALLKQQGLIEDSAEREASAAKMRAALNKLGERVDTSLKMIKDSFTPVALAKIGPSKLDATATQVQTVMQRLARGEIEMTKPGMNGLVELFGTQKRANDLLKQFKEARSAKESQALDESGVTFDQSEDDDGVADTGIGGDLEESEGNLRTEFHGPFDLSNNANRERLAKRLANVAGASPSSAVKEVGLWDKLKAEHTDADELFAAEQQALMDRGVDLSKIDDGTRTRMLKRLNKTVRFVQDTRMDDSDKLDRVKLSDLREKAGHEGKGTPDTVSEGRLYLEREVEVDDPDAPETITEDGEIVRPKKKERRAFLTSTSKLLKHANRSGDKLTTAEGARETGDKVLASISALMTSGNGFTGRVGFRPSDTESIQWQDGLRTLPASLRLTSESRFGDARYNSTGGKPATSWTEDVTHADLRDMSDADLTRFIEEKTAELKDAGEAQKKRLQSLVDHAQDLLDNGPEPERVIDNLESMAEPFRLNEDRPAKPVERGADGNVATPTPNGKLPTGARKDDPFRPMVSKKASAKQIRWLVDNLRKGVPALTAAIKGLTPERADAVRQALFELLSMDPRDSRLAGLINDFEAFQKRVSNALLALGIKPVEEPKVSPSDLPEPKGFVPTSRASTLDERINSRGAADASRRAGQVGLDMKGKDVDHTKANTAHQTSRIKAINRAALREKKAAQEPKAAQAAEPKAEDKREAFVRKLIEAGKGAEKTIAKLTDAQLDAALTYVENLFKNMDSYDSPFVEHGPYGDKKLNALEDMMLDELNTREDGARANSQSPTSPKNELSEADMALLVEDIKSRLGNWAKVEFPKFIKGLDGKGRISGDWKRGLIRIAQRALDPLGVARHESVHQLFSMMRDAGSSEMQEVLTRVATSPMIQNRMRRLLGDHPAAIEQLKDPEEAAAYMYQFWAAGMLELGPKTEGFFRKVADFLRNLVGAVRQELRDTSDAEAIMAEFTQGAFAGQDADAAMQVIEKHLRDQRFAYEDSLLNRMVNHKVLKNYIHTAGDVLHDSKNPALIALADRLFTREGAKMKEQAYFDAVPAQRAKWLNSVNDIFRGKDQEDVDTALKHLQAETPADKIGDPVVGEIVARVRKHLDDMWKYMNDAGVERWNSDTGQWEPTPKIKANYFPRVWDVDMVTSRTKEFADLLIEHHLPNLEFIATNAGVSVEQVIEGIVQHITANAGASDISENASALGITPFMQSLNKRGLNWIKPEVFEPFMSKDISKILTGYTVQAVKRAEYVSRFGNRGEGLQAALDEALGHEISSRDQAVMEDLSKQLAKAEKEWFEADPDKRQEEPPTLREIALRNIDKSVVKKSFDVMASPIKAIMAAEGTLGANITEKKRDVYSWVTTYQNFRLLPFALFSSLVDPLGIIVRGGTINDAYNAYVAGVRELVAGWKGKVTTDEAAKLAERIGSVDAGTFMDALGQTTSSLYSHGTTRKLNDWLFKWNGMESWNRAMRIQATQAAIGFIEQHLTNPNKHSERYLKDELNLHGSAEEYMKGDKLDTDNPVVQQAIVRWVNGAILRPNAMQRPIMASDPHYQLFYHLKQFSYSFHKTILQRAYVEGANGNFSPVVTLLGGYVAVSIAADILKELLLPGDDPPWMKMGLGEAVRHGVQRANLMGVPQLGIDNAMYAAGRGNPLELGGLLGPAPDQLLDWLMTPISENHSVGGELIRAMPASGAVSRAATLVD